MNKKNIIIVAVVVSIAVVVYYRAEIATFARENVYSFIVRENNLAMLREVSVTTTYTVPDGEDTERFSVFLDNDGVVVVVTAANIAEPEEESQTHVREFAYSLTKMIKGKKLSELGPVDKVGSSSLTTAAFNAALPDLQAQI